MFEVVERVVTVPVGSRGATVKIEAGADIATAVTRTRRAKVQ
jgi:hypothetical protein